jgi:transposase-like protein
MGGKPKNRHRQGRPQRLGTRRTGGPGGKTPVLSLINRETGEVRSEVMERVDRSTIGKAIREHVDTANSHLMTDTGGWYAQIGPSFLSHETVAHWRYEYVRGDVSTNAAEGYFSQLKRSIDGTHHQVTKQHLPRYLAEFDFRYSTCKLSDTARTERLFAQVAGRRLTYRPTIGNSAGNRVQ